MQFATTVQAQYTLSEIPYRQSYMQNYGFDTSNYPLATLQIRIFDADAKEFTDTSSVKKHLIIKDKITKDTIPYTVSIASQRTDSISITFVFDIMNHDWNSIQPKAMSLIKKFAKTMNVGDQINVLGWGDSVKVIADNKSTSTSDLDFISKNIDNLAPHNGFNFGAIYQNDIGGTPSFPGHDGFQLQNYVDSITSFPNKYIVFVGGGTLEITSYNTTTGIGHTDTNVYNNCYQVYDISGNAVDFSADKYRMFLDKCDTLGIGIFSICNTFGGNFYEVSSGEYFGDLQFVKNRYTAPYDSQTYTGRIYSNNDSATYPSAYNWNFDELDNIKWFKEQLYSDTKWSAIKIAINVHDLSKNNIFRTSLDLFYSSVIFNFDSVTNNRVISMDQNINPIMIFPNPSSQFITVSSFQNQKFSIYNLQGNAVFDNTETNKKIPISQLPEGTYFIKLQNQQSMMKFVKE